MKKTIRNMTPTKRMAEYVLNQPCEAEAFDEDVLELKKMDVPLSEVIKTLKTDIYYIALSVKHGVRKTNRIVGGIYHGTK